MFVVPTFSCISKYFAAKKRPICPRDKSAKVDISGRTTIHLHLDISSTGGHIGRDKTIFRGIRGPAINIADWMVLKVN